MNHPEHMFKSCAHLAISAIYVVQEGLRNCDALELPRTGAYARCTLCFPLEGVLRECSVKSNHTKLMLKNLAISATMWFEHVRRGSMHPNYPKLGLKHAAHFLCHVKVYLEKVQRSRTTPNTCVRTLHTLISLQ